MYKIQEVTGADLALGGNVEKLMPKYEKIPDEFKQHYNKWNKVVSEWFFCGFKTARWIPKEGVNTNKALAHIKAILVSWQPKHEHKEAGCAFLLNEWFEDVIYEKK